MSRLRSVLRLALTVSLIASTQSLLVIQGAFHLDRESIAERFCVNKADLDLGCEGSCELRRRMEAQRKSETERGVAVLEIALAVAATVTGRPAVPPPPPAPEASGGGAVLAPATGHDAGVFRPPRPAPLAA